MCPLTVKSAAPSASIPNLSPNSPHTLSLIFIYRNKFFWIILLSGLSFLFLFLFLFSQISFQEKLLKSGWSTWGMNSQLWLSRLQRRHRNRIWWGFTLRLTAQTLCNLLTSCWLSICQQTTNNLPTTNQQTTNNLPTTYQQLTNILPMTYQQLTNNLPTTYQQLTNNLPTTYQQPTNNLPTYHQLTNNLPTYQQLTNNLLTYWCPTNNLPTTYQPTNNLLTTYQQPTNNLPTTYQKHATNNLQATYWLPTNNIPTTSCGHLLNFYQDVSLQQNLCYQTVSCFFIMFVHFQSQSKVPTTLASKDLLSSGSCLGADTLLKLLGNYCRNKDIKTAITVGVVGGCLIETVAFHLLDWLIDCFFVFLRWYYSWLDKYFGGEVGGIYHLWLTNYFGVGGRSLEIVHCSSSTWKRWLS